MKKLNLIILAFITLCGCNSYQKQLNTYRAFGLAHTDQAALICAQLFPVKDSIGKTKVDSVHVSKNLNYINQIDSLQSLVDILHLKNDLDTAKTNPCASIAKKYQSDISILHLKIDALKTAYLPCKPDTVYNTTTVYRKDIAELTVQQNKNKILGDSIVYFKTKLKEETDTAHSWRKWALIAFGIILISVAGTVLKILGKI